MRTHTDDRTDRPNPEDQGRRDFIAAATTVLAGSAATFLSSPAQAQGVGSARGVGNGTYLARGMAAYGPSEPLKPMELQRRALGPKDVAIEIHYCGVCHSDIHTIHEDWGKVQFPQIVGHEVAGKVVAVGSSVSRFKQGARVGVGTMVNSCRHCPECAAGFENYCLNGNTQIYGSKDRDGTITQGGYSTFIVVDEDFVLTIPDPIDLAEAGPLLCAGITVYHPLRKWGVSSGQRVAIVGMGGLGHLAVKFGKAMGAEVTVFTTTPGKIEDAKRFGAKNVVVNKDGADFSAFKHAFDFALDTVPYKHDLNRFIPLLQPGATYCRVGVGKVVDSNEIGQMNLVLYRNALAGANTGGVRETQDMLNFCALNKIRPQIQKVSMTEIDGAWKNVFDKKVRYRHVIDMKA